MGYIETIRKKVGHDPLVIAFAAVVLLNEQKEVLLEERADDGYWDIPGGSIEFNETAEDAARRELAEETQLQAKRLRFFKVYSGPLTYYRYPNGDVVSGVDLVYLGQGYEGKLVPQEEEVRSLKWFPLDAIPAKISPRNKAIFLDLRAQMFPPTPKGKK